MSGEISNTRTANRKIIIIIIIIPMNRCGRRVTAQLCTGPTLSSFLSRYSFIGSVLNKEYLAEPIRPQVRRQLSYSTWKDVIVDSIGGTHLSCPLTSLRKIPPSNAGSLLPPPGYTTISSLPYADLACSWLKLTGVIVFQLNSRRVRVSKPLHMELSTLFGVRGIDLIWFILADGRWIKRSS